MITQWLPLRETSWGNSAWKLRRVSRQKICFPSETLRRCQPCNYWSTIRVQNAKIFDSLYQGLEFQRSDSCPSFNTSNPFELLSHKVSSLSSLSKRRFKNARTLTIVSSFVELIFNKKTTRRRTKKIQANSIFLLTNTFQNQVKITRVY